MVSWDLKVKFLGISPHIKELVKLSKKEGFSNVENIEQVEDGVCILHVNNRGLRQTKFKLEIIE